MRGRIVKRFGPIFSNLSPTKKLLKGRDQIALHNCCYTCPNAELLPSTMRCLVYKDWEWARIFFLEGKSMEEIEQDKFNAVQIAILVAEKCPHYHVLVS